MRNAMYGVDGKTRLSQLKGPLAALVILIIALTSAHQVMAANTFYVWMYVDSADGNWYASTSDPGTSCYNKLQTSTTYGSPDSDYPQSSGSPYMFRLMSRCTGGPGDGRIKGGGLSTGFRPDGYTRSLKESFWPIGSGTSMDLQIRSYAMSKVPASGAGIVWGPGEWIYNPGFNNGVFSPWIPHVSGSGSITAVRMQEGTDGTTNVYSYTARTIGANADAAWNHQLPASNSYSYKMASFLIRVASYGSGGGGQKISFQQGTDAAWKENTGVALLFNNQGVWAKACSSSWTKIISSAISTNVWHQFSIWQAGSQVFIIDNTTGSSYTLSFGANCPSGANFDWAGFGDPGADNEGTFYWDNIVAMGS